MFSYLTLIHQAFTREKKLAAVKPTPCIYRVNTPFHLKGKIITVMWLVI